MTDKIYIYALCDPRTHEVRYVGKTDNIDRRYKQHIKRNSKTHKDSWINQLKNNGLKPSIQIIDTATELDWKVKEQYWIGMFPDLVNMTSGGENPPKIYGSKHWNTKLTEKDIETIIEQRLTGKPIFIIANDFNVSRWCIDRILKNKTWKHTNQNKIEIKTDRRGEYSSRAKLTKQQVIEIKLLINSGYQNKYISEKLNIKKYTVKSIRSGKSWSNVTI